MAGNRRCAARSIIAAIFSLQQPVLLFRNHHLPLDEPLMPGESREFSLNLPNYYEARRPGRRRGAFAYRRYAEFAR